MPSKVPKVRRARAVASFPAGPESPIAEVESSNSGSAIVIAEPVYVLAHPTTRNAVHAALKQSVQTSITPNARVEAISFLKAVAEFATVEYPHLKYDRHNMEHLMGVSMYATMIQLASAICQVSSAGPSVATPTLARQATDAFLDLRLLLKDADYWKRLECADAIYWQKLFEVSSAGKNPILGSLSKEPTLPARRKENAQLIKKRKDAGLAPLAAEDRFRKLDIQDEYATWQLLSAFAHNSSSSAIGRCFVISSDQPPSPKLKPDLVPFEVAAILQLGDYLMHATSGIHERYGRKQFDDLVIRKRHAAIQLLFQKLHEENERTIPIESLTESSSSVLAEGLSRVERRNR